MQRELELPGDFYLIAWEDDCEATVAIVLTIFTFREALVWQRENLDSIRGLFPPSAGGIGSLVVQEERLGQSWRWSLAGEETSA